MPIDWFPLWLSLRVAVVSTAVALALGLWLAYILANREFRGKEILDAAITLPLVLPPTVLGYYLLVLIGRASPLGKIWEIVFGSPLVFTWKAAVVAALLHSLPLLVKSARAAFESVDRRYERAARTLGDFGVTLMVAGNIPGRTQTVALAIYDAVEAGNGAVARTLVLVMSAVALLVLTVANRVAMPLTESR